MNTKSRPGSAMRHMISRLAFAVATCATAAGASAQNINDVPMAVKNNVAPNFMFMIDNSGSMSNIVPTSPYDASVDYTPAGCSGGSVIGAGTSVDLRLTGTGAPRIRYGGTDYLHYSLATSGTRRCFNRTAIYGARLLADNGGQPGSYLDADYDGNYLNWYFGNNGGAVTGWIDRKLVTTGSVNTRMEIARTSTTAVMNGLPLPASATAPAAVRAGLSTYNSGNGGRLRVAMNDLTATSRATINASIATLAPSGNTPLATTLADIGRYMATGYNGNVTAGSVSGVNIDTFLYQDGTDQSGRNSCLASVPVSCSSTSATAAQKPIQQWCQRSYAFLVTDGRPQQDRGFNDNSYIRDYDGDCQGALASSCVSSGAAGSWDRKTGRTYESAGSDYLDDVAKALYDIDLRPDLTAPAGRTKKNNLLTYTIGFADLQVQNDPLLIATAANGGGLFLSAQDGPTLESAFRTVITDALAKDAASAAVAVVNAQITVNNTAYASSYNSGSWYGDLEAFTLDTSTGVPVGAAQWSARVLLDAKTSATRNIATYNGATGVAFTSAIAGTPASLTAGVINYLRGDRTGEGSTYRTRRHLLGDIINAEPAVVTYSGNVPIIFQPANDGMLHVFDGRIDAGASTRGQELWAYVPRLVHGNLADLANPTYTHKYYVDGTPAAAEITGAGAMTRILVGGLGKGGNGFYALDITDYQAADEAAAVAKVKWEFTAANMGYSFGKPLIVNTAAGWRVVVTSGYGNGTTLGGDGVGRVWVLNPADGSVVRTMSTGVGSAADPSGLAHLAKMSNIAPDAVVRYVYGGDLKGNVWRFDLDTGAVTQIAALRDGTGAYQPVSAPPSVGPVAGSSTKVFVYVGTGRYLSDDDVPGTATPNTWATQTQSMYGIVDDTSVSLGTPNIRGTNGTSCPTGGGNGDLVCQTISSLGGTPERFGATTHPVDQALKRGWYVDLPVSNARVNTEPALTTGGTLAFTANVPTNTICDPGGSSYFFTLYGSTGGAVPRVVGGNTYYDAGTFLTYALVSRPQIVTTATGKYAIFRFSDKTTGSKEIGEAGSIAASWRRIYWRTLK